MKKLLKSYKTEINPSHEQIQKINKTIGTCRFIYNFYIAHNKELYNKGEKFMTAKSFSVWLNNEFLPNNPNYSWIKEVSSKSVKKSMENAYTAFNKFFKKQNKFPRFKKKNKSDVKMYFVKNNPKDCFCERHRINIPTLGWVKLKEKGYIIYATGLKENSLFLDEVNKSPKMAFVLGNEGSGVSKEVFDSANETVKIQMHNIDSLNVAMAGSIIMYRFLV